MVQSMEYDKDGIFVVMVQCSICKCNFKMEADENMCIPSYEICDECSERFLKV